MTRRRLVVTGRVQGVFFRGWLVEQARTLGVAGWVRNRADGSVEALIAGPPDRIEEIARRCHAGPAAARVAGVAVYEDDGAEPLDGFARRATA